MAPVDRRPQSVTLLLLLLLLLLLTEMRRQLGDVVAVFDGDEEAVR